ncbi:DUF2537 domain-containing protein [Rhodococcus sp. JVH1]|uniref:DUF2537 domain-containing protein n=1 Tax=Rhodococcus sp. JVH1 TaxID=745408 RepID=UPI00027226FC|nr:DUF2537 domain-containing protein [Rhodococcus sp. JVH1]EJI96518.1 hypothetical protein JVH1_6293 [Rhodococcus sp. JVH1]
MLHPHSPYPQPTGTPWFTGLLVAGFAAVVVAVAIMAFGSQLARIHLALAVVLELVVVAGVAPSVWRLRRTPVWRWLVYGAAAGVVAGWTALLVGAA